MCEKNKLAYWDSESNPIILVSFKLSIQLLKTQLFDLYKEIFTVAGLYASNSVLKSVPRNLLTRYIRPAARFSTTGKLR